MGKFGRAILPNILKQASPEFHQEVYALLNNPRAHKRAVIAPRGHAKSVCDSIVYPLHRHLFKRQSETRYTLIGSETQDQAVNFLTTIKGELETNPIIHRHFGNLVGGKWTQDFITLSNGGAIRAIGSGQRVRGTNYKAQRPTDVILDDIESEYNTLTFEARKRVQDWVAGAVEPSMDPDGYLTVAGTIVHQDAFLAIIKEDPTYHRLFYQAIMDGKALWPERYPLEKLNQILESYRARGQAHMFYQEYMNEPRNPEEQAFRKEDFRYWEGEIFVKNRKSFIRLKRDNGETIVKPVNVYLGVDLAIGTRGDFNVIAPLAIDSQGNMYLEDYVRVRAQPWEIIDEIFRHHQLYAPSLIIVETVAYQKALVSYLRREMGQRNIYLPVKEEPHPEGGGKEKIRHLALEPYFKQGLVHFKRRHHEAESEFLAWPKATNDDLADAIWLAHLYATRPVEQWSERPRERRQRDRKQSIQNWKVA